MSHCELHVTARWHGFVCGLGTLAAASFVFIGLPRCSAVVSLVWSKHDLVPTRATLSAADQRALLVCHLLVRLRLHA